MSINQSDVLIIGGGAAGYFAALICAEAAPGAKIVILERAGSPLAKVKISGGGRCNVTHASYEPAKLVTFYPHGGKALRGPFTRFGPQHLVQWFVDRGVSLKTETDGRMFPTSDRSETIIDCFESEAKRLGVELRLQTVVGAVNPLPTGLEVECLNEETWHAKCVLLATGGARPGHVIAQRLGHTIIEAVPSLFTFNITDQRLNGLAGLSVPDARLRLPAAKLEQRGPLLITHWGLSGPAALRLSAWGARYLFEQNYQTELRLSWLGDFTPEKLKAVIQRLRSENGKQRIYAASPVSSIPLRLWERLAWVAGIKPSQHWADASKELLEMIEMELLDCPLRITGKGEFKEEFVTSGGVDLDEVDFRSLESRKQPGLFLAGEVLDIDGVTGGFNFQAAWTTAWHAGKAMAERENS
jgi:predicted Rossmann fold flavoprotein